MKRALNADDANKKARSEPAPAAAEDPHAKYSAEFEQIAMAQDEIEKLNAEASEETLKIERKFAEKKKPHMRRRNDICTKIPGFWLSCVSSSDPFSLLLGGLTFVVQGSQSSERGCGRGRRGLADPLV
jgi:hypothetical protein